MNACPYRDETARLLLHVFCAIKVSFFTILPILLTGILLRICKGGMVSVKAYYNETVETVRRDLNGEQDFLTNEEVKRRQEKFGFNELAEGKHQRQKW